MRWAGFIVVTTLAMSSPAWSADAELFSSASPTLEPTWSWVGAAAAVGLVAGFAIGWRVLAARIRKKYGGLKIY